MLDKRRRRKLELHLAAKTWQNWLRLDEALEGSVLPSSYLEAQLSLFITSNGKKGLRSRVSKDREIGGRPGPRIILTDDLLALEEAYFIDAHLSPAEQVRVKTKSTRIQLDPEFVAEGDLGAS